MSKLHISSATKKKLGRFELGIVDGTIPDENDEHIKSITLNFNRYRFASFVFVSDGWRRENGKYHKLGLVKGIIFTRHLAIDLKPKKLKTN